MRYAVLRLSCFAYSFVYFSFIQIYPFIHLKTFLHSFLRDDTLQDDTKIKTFDLAPIE